MTTVRRLASPRPQALATRDRRADMVPQPGDVAHGIVGEEGHHKCDDVESNTPARLRSCSSGPGWRGRSIFRQRATQSGAPARKPSAESSNWACPGDQDAAAEAVDVSAGDHQRLPGDESKEGLQDEQDAEHRRSPQTIAPDRGNDQIQVTEPLKRCGQRLTVDPGRGQGSPGQKRDHQFSAEHGRLLVLPFEE